MNPKSTVLLMCLFANVSVCVAGGIERKNQSISPLFEQGNYVHLSLTSFLPEVSGRDVAGQATGNVYRNFDLLEFGFKWDLNERLALALIYDQPYGVSTSYRALSPVLGGTSATASVDSLTSVVQYKFANRFGLIGGLSLSTFEGSASLGGLAFSELSGYSASLEKSTEVGYLLGASYAIPSIKFHSAITYRSDIEHVSDLMESISQGVSDLPVTLPQSVTVDISTGISKDVLVFASVYWQDWSEFEIAPSALTAVSGQGLLSFEKDSISYTLGVAKSLSQEWVAGAHLQREEGANSGPTPFGPVNGHNRLGLFATYSYDNAKVTFGYSYTEFGDADPQLQGSPSAEFSDNNGVSLGLSVGYKL